MRIASFRFVSEMLTILRVVGNSFFLRRSFFPVLITVFALPVFGAGVKKVAVLEFTDLSSRPHDLKSFSEQLPYLIEQRLGREEKITLQERRALEKILQEIELSQTGLLEDTKSVEVGRLLQADDLITGSFSVGEESKIVVSFRAIDVASGEVLYTARINAESGFELFKNIEKAAGMAAAAILGERTAKVSVSSTPEGAEVFLNGSFVGETPVVDYPVTPGTYELRMEKKSYYPHRQNLEFSANQQQTKQVDLTYLGYKHPDYRLKAYLMFVGANSYATWQEGRRLKSDTSTGYGIGFNYLVPPLLVGAFWQRSYAVRESELIIFDETAEEERRYTFDYTAIRVGYIFTIHKRWLIFAPYASLGYRRIVDKALFSEETEAPYQLRYGLFQGGLHAAFEFIPGSRFGGFTAEVGYLPGAKITSYDGEFNGLGAKTFNSVKVPTDQLLFLIGVRVPISRNIAEGFE